MEFLEGSVYVKTLKRAVNTSVENILTKHKSITENSQLSQQEFDNIVGLIMKTNEIKSIVQRFIDDYDTFDMGKPTFVVIFEKADRYDDTKFESLIKKYHACRSLADRVPVLKEICQYPLLDLIEKDKWSFLAKTMRESLVSKSKELFAISFKMHIKFSHHPRCIMEATTNLLKHLTSMFLSRKGPYSMSTSFEMKQQTQEQIFTIVDLVVHNIKHLNKNDNYTKDRNISHLITIFMDLIIAIHSEKYEPLQFINYVAGVDPKGSWFRELMYNPANRNMILEICIQNSPFIRYLVNEIVTAINITDCAQLKSIKTEISAQVLKLATFSTCINMLSKLLCYKEAHQLLPIEIKVTEKPITIQGLLIIILNAINHLSGCSKQNNKRNILTDAAQEILIHNRYLLYNKDIADILIKPFHINALEKHRFIDIAHRNKYILNIINEISNTQDGFLIIFGLRNEIQTKTHRRNKQNQYIRSKSLPEPLVISTFIDKYVKQHCCSYSATDRYHITFGKMIIDFTITLVRRYVNLYEKFINVDSILFELFECCYNIYACHSHVIYLVNTQKLIAVTLHLFRILTDRNLIQNTMNPIVKFLVLICGSKSGIYLAKEDPEAMYFICKTVFALPETDVWTRSYFHKFFLNICDRASGHRAILESKKQLITPYLNRIWKIDEDELVFVTGSSRQIDETVFAFAKIMYTMSFSLYCIQTLLAYDADDDSTLVDADKQATNIRDLIEDTLSSSGPGTIACHVGLMTIRILINNINILIFLQHSLKLKETLQMLQTECTTSFYDDNTAQPNSEVVLDECSLLRRNIIKYIQSIGFLKRKSQNCQRSQKLENIQSSATTSARIRKLNEMQRYLNESKNNLHDCGWLVLARKIYKSICNEPLREPIFVELIQQVRLTVPNTKNYFIWPDNNDTELSDLFPEDQVGIFTIIQFGIANKILPSSMPYEDILTLLIKQVNSFLNITRSKFNGFDWFVGIVFLICSGNIDRSKTVLQCMIHLPVTPYIWATFGLQMGIRRKFSYFAHFDHTLNILVEDLEVLIPALESACISWNAITRNWLEQCFFHILEWDELLNFITMAILFPPEYILFYLICAAQYLEPKFMAAINSTDINAYLKILHLEDFRLCDAMSSMELMGRQYKNILLKY